MVRVLLAVILVASITHLDASFDASSLGLQRSFKLTKTNPLNEDESVAVKDVTLPHAMSSHKRRNPQVLSLLGMQRSVSLSKTVIQETEVDVAAGHTSSGSGTMSPGLKSTSDNQDLQFGDYSLLGLQRKVVVSKKNNTIRR